MTDEKKSTSKSSDAGQGEVQDAFEKAQQQGYVGQGIDPLPNSAHSLQSGPESPTAAEQLGALAKKKEA